ncbi:hypothetical protein [Candidatus Pelagibacter sp. HIMB1506]|uniref:hypothetical protein n=1 Tax=Candidatus Pelagibacter sp. HIMB1506 TaxID=3413337 RepID=UPI003F853F54
MKYLLIIFLIFLSNCSLNKDSQYWTEHPAESKKKQKKIIEILKKSDDITKMTLEEYEIYIDDYTKKSKYPDISK